MTALGRANDISLLGVNNRVGVTGEIVEVIPNSFDFVCDIMQRLADAQISTWLFGGWAEELREMSPSRRHNDVDLLYPAADFHQLDQWLSMTTDFSSIPAKHYSHKRAMLYDKVMIEVVLLEPYLGGYVTHFFDDKYQMLWPVDTLASLTMRGINLSVASRHALQQYRQNHSLITQAYQDHLLLT